jgi:AcrR family transcriptional regulator
VTQLIEQRSRKAARILDSARELMLDHGVRKVTVNEIARAAGVAKGTVYLYWAAKEDLIVGLFARELLTFLDELIARITADHTMVLPHRLAPLLISTGLNLPLKSRLKSGDADLMRLLSEAENRDLFDRIRPSALCNTVLPALRHNGLIRHDRPLATQAYVLHAVLAGFDVAVSNPASAAPLGVDAPAEVLSDTIAQLFAPPVAPAALAISAAAADTVAILHEARDAVLDLIERSQVTQE